MKTTTTTQTRSLDESTPMTPQSIVVGASVLVPTEGSGVFWSVGVSSIGPDGNSTLHTVGDFAAAGSTDWTTVTLTMPVDDVAGYVDDNNEMLLTVSCSEPGSTQVGVRVIVKSCVHTRGSRETKKMYICCWEVTAVGTHVMLR